jgi:hypothetical protein
MGAVTTASEAVLACTKLVQEPQSSPRVMAMAAKFSDLRRQEMLLKTTAESDHTHLYPQNPRVNPEIRRR